MHYEQTIIQTCFAILESKYVHIFAIFIQGDISKYTLYMYCYSKLYIFLFLFLFFYLPIHLFIYSFLQIISYTIL